MTAIRLDTPWPLAEPKRVPHNFKNIRGQRIGRLNVLAVGPSIGAKATWACLCDCGRGVFVRAELLHNRQTQSCGCLRTERIRATKRVHGHCSKARGNSRTYRIWNNMRTRCSNPGASNYRWYGARGVTYCERWDTFANFLADMGEAPTGLTLDRIDPAGNYEPGNCRWATMKQQANNRMKQQANNRRAAR